MPNPPFQLILFDFDGTLADSFSATIQVANRLALKHGYRPLDVTPPALIALKNRGTRQLIRESGVPARKLLFLIRQMKKGLQREIPSMASPPGLGPALATLKEAGCSLGIVTSNSRENIDLFLRRHQWADWFDHIETGSSLFGKSRLIRRILIRSGFPASAVSYVGDEERDVEAARRAGVSSVAVTWGFNARSLLARALPDHILDTPSQLPDTLLPPNPK